MKDPTRLAAIKAICEKQRKTGDEYILVPLDFASAAADPEYGLQALAAEVERLQEREKPVKMDASRTWPRGTGDGTLRECDCGNITGWHPYCPHCGRKLEWK